MIRGRRARRPTRVFVMRPRRNQITYDYLITNDAEWATVFGLGAATLSGKTIGVNGELSARTLSSFDPTLPVTILGFGGCSIPRLQLSNVSNLTCRNVLFQHKAWPRSATEIVRLETGTFSNLVFDGCTFRHGYGAGNADLSGTTQYPEYTRVDNVTNATTTSSRIALSFQDPAATSAWVEFFNRGSQNVYYRLGNSSVVATASDTLVVPGTASFRSANFNPQTTTHVAVISASGTQQVNARAEIGMSEYLTAAFSSSGGITINNFTVRNCIFSDLNNAIKGIGAQASGSSLILMDNETRRIYQDQIALTMAAGVSYYIFRNILEMPIARSGIAEVLNGDARDPHGDLIQAFGTGAGTVGPVYSAGNMVRIPARRSGVNAQGLFLSDNDINPNYDRVFSIGDVFGGGAGRGISVGEASGGFYHRRGLFFGGTVFDTTNLSNNNAGIQAQASSHQEVAIIDTVTANITDTGLTTALQSGNVILPSTASPSACFPNIGTLSTASSRSQLQTAFTTAAESAGKGAVAKQSAIDWGTTDHLQVIKWDQIPSGAVWSNQTDVALNTLITFPLRRILNERANQAVIPLDGAAWRSVDTDGTTEVQAWTTSSGTIQPNQYIQFRATSSASNNTITNPGLSINGFESRASLTTVAAFAARGALFDGTDYWSNSTITGLTGTSRGMLSMWLRHTGTWAATKNLFILYVGGTQPISIISASSGRMTFRNNQDGTGTDTFTTATSTFAGDTWYHLLWSWDWAASRFQIYVNNVSQNTSAYLFTGATKFDIDGASITQHAFGAAITPANYWTGDLGHVYLNLAESLDFTVAANREKFALAGVPVNLGNDGSLPTGNVPAYYWDGVPPNWDNKGSVADGTLTGSLVASSAPTPSY